MYSILEAIRITAAYKLFYDWVPEECDLVFRQLLVASNHEAVGEQIDRAGGIRSIMKKLVRDGYYRFETPGPLTEIKPIIS